MNLNINELEPLEEWFKLKAAEAKHFPSAKNDYFDRYWDTKKHLAQYIYPYIGAGTSAEDQGIYTDHSIDHFNAVIRYAGKLLGLDNQSDLTTKKLTITPYEAYILLVSILLHDAGNINGRRDHEKRPLEIFKGIGKNVCPDDFEGMFIARIAQSHGGKSRGSDGQETKDTIRNTYIKELDNYGSIPFRPRAIAALVRFSDEICEDRSRAARYLIQNSGLPKKSEIFHHYANSISSVDVDLIGKSISIKYQLTKKSALHKFGKVGSEDQYLIDEINERLEKMFCELCYCKSFMLDLVNINRIRASVEIVDDDEYMTPLTTEVFELEEKGYPSQIFSFSLHHPEWCGEKVYQTLSIEPQ